METANNEGNESQVSHFNGLSIENVTIVMERVCYVSKNKEFQQKRNRKHSTTRFLDTEEPEMRSGLNHRKDSTMGYCGDDVTPSEEKLLTCEFYPFAVVLRLRVLQIVCGISALVMGTVAFIQERGRLNLGLGMPAGILTVTAAAVSIHTSRGFSGYSQPTCGPQLRFLGPNARVAVPLTCLWLSAIILHTVLIIVSIVSLITTPEATILASVLLFLAFLSLLAVVLILRIDCVYDPD